MLMQSFSRQIDPRTPIFKRFSHRWKRRWLTPFLVAGAAVPGIYAQASALLATPLAPLPDAPAPAPPIVKAALAPGEQPLVLPRNFRIRPAAARSNKPGKVSYYLRTTVSGRNLLEAFAVAGVPNITAAPVQPRAPSTDDPVLSLAYQRAIDQYDSEIDGWRRVNEATLRYHGYRFGVGLGTAETRQLFSNLVLPLALHQEARYLPAPVNSDFSERIGHALASIVVTRNDAGALVPNYSKLGGTVAAAFVGKAVYAKAFDAPELDTNHFATRYIAYSLAGDAATNVAHEVVRAALEPDLTFYDRHGRATEDSYYPLSAGGKLIYWARSTYAVRNFVSAALLASRPVIPPEPNEPVEGDPSTYGGYPNYDSAYNHYGDIVLAWKDGIENDVRYRATRFAGGLAESETQMMLGNLVIPILFDMDPRYVPLGAGHTAGQRFGHAVEGLWITHTDKGDRMINLPILGGTVGAAFLAKEVYYPQLGVPALESTGVLARTITANLAADAVYNVIGEFLRHRGY